MGSTGAGAIGVGSTGDGAGVGSGSGSNMVAGVVPCTYLSALCEINCKSETYL